MDGVEPARAHRVSRRSALVGGDEESLYVAQRYGEYLESSFRDVDVRRAHRENVSGGTRRSWAGGTAGALGDRR